MRIEHGYFVTLSSTKTLRPCSNEELGSECAQSSMLLIVISAFSDSDYQLLLIIVLRECIKSQSKLSALRMLVFDNQVECTESVYNKIIS
jgi:hypothetical protein